MRKLVAELPRAYFATLLHYLVFGFAKPVHCPLCGEIQSQRQSCKTIAQNAIMYVAAGGEVTGQRRRPFPHLATAAGVLVVAIGEGLVSGKPQSLDQKHHQQSGCDALRQIEAKTAEDAKPVSHSVQSNVFQSKRCSS